MGLKNCCLGFSKLLKMKTYDKNFVEKMFFANIPQNFELKKNTENMSKTSSLWAPVAIFSWIYQKMAELSAF